MEPFPRGTTDTMLNREGDSAPTMDDAGSVLRLRFSSRRTHSRKVTGVQYAGCAVSTGGDLRSGRFGTQALRMSRQAHVPTGRVATCSSQHTLYLLGPMHVGILRRTAKLNGGVREYDYSLKRGRL